MKIGFDVSQTGKEKTGCGFFADNLIQKLALMDRKNQYTLYPTFGDHYWDDFFQKTTQIHQLNFKQGPHYKTLLEATAFWKKTPESIEKKLDIDILHVNNFFCPSGFNKTRIIYTLYDLSFFEYPSCTTEANRMACFNGVFKASVYADGILCISECTRQHFLANFPYYPEKRVAVSYLGSRFSGKQIPASPSSRLSQFQPNKFWLSVGTLEPRKNIQFLLRVFARLVSNQPTTYPLLLVGKVGWLEENIQNLIIELGLTSHVYVLGYTSDSDLAWLYTNCFCFVYPSLFEGFGLPVLEALEFGAPVITSNSSALPEVTGDAALLICPKDEEELFQALLRMINDFTYRETLTLLGKNQAKQFSWENTARKVLRFYNEIMQQPKYTDHKTDFLF